MNLIRTILLAGAAGGAALSMSGCQLFSFKALNPDCHSRQEYLQAQQRAPLKVPEGLDAPNTQGALVVPVVEVAPPAPGPKDQCLDVPPRYVPSATTKAGSTG
jgi:uncharacterized lipoprotein